MLDPRIKFLVSSGIKNSWNSRILGLLALDCCPILCVIPSVPFVLPRVLLIVYDFSIVLFLIVDIGIDFVQRFFVEFIELFED